MGNLEEQYDTSSFTTFCESYSSINEGFIGRSPEDTIAKSIVKVIRNKAKEANIDPQSLAKKIYMRFQ